MSLHMTMPQASTLVEGVHFAVVVEVPATSFQLCILVVVLSLALSTGMVGMVVVGHRRAPSRRRGC